MKIKASVDVCWKLGTMFDMYNMQAVQKEHMKKKNKERIAAFLAADPAMFHVQTHVMMITQSNELAAIVKMRRLSMWKVEHRVGTSLIKKSL